MNAKQLAMKSSLTNTQDRVERAIAETTAQENRTTNLVEFTGVDEDRGMMVGQKPNGSTVYFALSTNAVPVVGEPIVVSMDRNSSYGRGDLRPVK